MPSGTEWTEPGQGATVSEIWRVIRGAVCFAAHRRIMDMVEPVERRTNLRLTGEPLTAEDLKRIEQCVST
jgi:hypothetical protein